MQKVPADAQWGLSQPLLQSGMPPRCAFQHLMGKAVKEGNSEYSHMHKAFAQGIWCREAHREVLYELFSKVVVNAVHLLL